MRYFALAFGRTLAALFVGFMLGLFCAWTLWLFWFAAAASWTILVSPAFIAGAELVAFLGLAAAWRLVRGAAEVSKEYSEGDLKAVWRELVRAFGERPEGSSDPGLEYGLLYVE